MNLPNRITVGRFVFAFVLFAYLVATDTGSGPDARWWEPAIAGLVFIGVVVTDALDGYYARKLNLQTDFGRIADPVVDKVLVAGALVFLASAGWARPLVPVWMVVLVLAREYMVSGLRGFIEARGVAFPARWDGKLKMVLQCIAIPAVFLHRTLVLVVGDGWEAGAWTTDASWWLAFVFVWASFALTVSSGARYVVAAAKVLRGSSAAADA